MQQSGFAQVEEVPAFSSSTDQVLDDIVRDFGLEGAREVKKVGSPDYSSHMKVPLVARIDRV